MQNHTQWIHCPVCGNKTRDRIREDTVLKNYPLYCPKCRQETLIEFCTAGFHGNFYCLVPEMVSGKSSKRKVSGFGIVSVLD